MNLKNLNKNILTIKKIIQKLGHWKKYKKHFRNKQMLFLSSKICLLFLKEDKIKLEFLANLEILLIDKKDPKMFVNFFAKEQLFFKNDYKQVNFEELALFLFYIYQTSSFYHDLLFKVNNIYNYNNLEQINAIKRNHYSNWLKDFKMTNKYFNIYLIQILKWVK